MLNDFTGAAHVYIACGYTDIRKGIDGLAVLVQQQFQLDPCSDALFLFCGRKRDRVPLSIMRKFFYKSGRTKSAQGGFPCPYCPIAEGRASVKGGEAACKALDASSVFCYQPAMSSCISRCFMLMYFLPPHWVPAT
ncbi:MAG: IS66 family insertion sequence element accessory protein TnpB [Faecousia sp.]